MRRDLEGGTHNMNKNIRPDTPNFLMIHFRLLIPLEILSLMMWFSTIEFIIVRWNVTMLTIIVTNLREFGVDKISVLIIMFDNILRLVTWHYELCFLNRSNTHILWIGWFTSISDTLHVFDVSNDSHNIVCLIIFTFFIYLIISDIVSFSFFLLKN